MGAYPGAGPRDSFESSHHHVVVDRSEVPGLTHASFGSPDDGGVRRYPSWDDVGDDIGDHGRDGFESRANDEMTRPNDTHAPVEPYGGEAGFAAETVSPGGAFRSERERNLHHGGERRREPSRVPAVGAFPGHAEADPATDLDAFRARAARSKKSFAVGGVDPIDMHFDSRAVREAALAEAKRAQFRAQLDEQVALKKRAEEERARLERREENVSDRDGRVGRSVDRISHHSHLTSPPRESMQGVPRRGVNPGNGDYSSPLARAGGGPSSFYLGGGDRVRGGGGNGGGDGAFTRFSEGNGAFVEARALDAAEARRRQLVADLDAQVRAKREQKRLQELREELEDAKIERRIQEVIEQERLEREMKERFLERPDNLGEYRVTNSPRASLVPPARPPSDAGRIGGRELSLPAETYEGAEIVHAEDSAAAAFDDAPATEDASALERENASTALDNDTASVTNAVDALETSAQEKTVSVPSPVPRALPADDDASALTPQRQLPRSPEVGARRPARVDVSARLNAHTDVVASRALRYADVPGLETHVGTTFPAPFQPLESLEGHSEGARRDTNATGLNSFEEASSEIFKNQARASTPLDVKISKLQAELERRDVDLESARDEARRLERERDLAERERDLEHQLHKIRTEMAAGGALGNAASRVAAAREKDGDENGEGKEIFSRRSFVGTDVASFVVRSGFVRADAPIGVSESQAMRGGTSTRSCRRGTPCARTTFANSKERRASPACSGARRARRRRSATRFRKRDREPPRPRRTTRAPGRGGRCGARTALRPRRAMRVLGGEPSRGTGGRETNAAVRRKDVFFCLSKKRTSFSTLEQHRRRFPPAEINFVKSVRLGLSLENAFSRLADPEKRKFARSGIRMG